MTQPWSNFQTYPGLQEDDQQPVYTTTQPYAPSYAPVNNPGSEIYTNSMGQSFRIQTVLVPLDPAEVTGTGMSGQPYASLLPSGAILPDDPSLYARSNYDYAMNPCCSPRYAMRR